VKYHVYAETDKDDGKSAILDVGEHMSSACPEIRSNDMPEGDPAADFGIDFVKAWTQTDDFRIFHKFTGMGHREM
jgi:hypothetical protein